MRTSVSRPCYPPAMRAFVLVLAAGLIVSSCAKAPPRTVPSAPATTVGSSVHNVIPQPTTIEALSGDGFSITANTIVAVTPGDERVLWIARYLADLIGLAAAPQPPRVEAAGAAIPRGAISAGVGSCRRRP